MAFKLSNKAYDILKYLCIIVIPALTTLYVTLDTIFGWGFGDTVAKVSSAVLSGSPRHSTTRNSNPYWI